MKVHLHKLPVTVGTIKDTPIHPLRRQNNKKYKLRQTIM